MALFGQFLSRQRRDHLNLRSCYQSGKYAPAVFGGSPASVSDEIQVVPIMPTTTVSQAMTNGNHFPAARGTISTYI